MIFMINTTTSFHQLKIPHPEQDFKIVGNILSGLKTEIGRSLPILGFAGAPVTLALFMIIKMFTLLAKQILWLYMSVFA